MDKTVEAIRIVTMDYYLAKPVQSLDPCYSELQNTVIKQVPIIRIFGSTRAGEKVCANVHGVLPYLYVPFDENSSENVDKMIHQLAISLDKALNISLARSNSKAIYVYKISLVKGIPFYGYHKSEEKFLKIYLLNPGLVKRTANLLLNGAVMGRTFQPHETHIPYILQFLVDHNLYGMSQLYVPSELISYRSNDASQLDSMPKTTSTANEVDFLSVHILNRILLAQQAKTGYGNPGIASIWEDEKIRRGVEELTELQPPMSQVRGYTKITGSDQFYRDMLRHRMSQNSESDQSRSESRLSETMIDSEPSILIKSGRSSQKSNEDEEELDQTIVNAEIAFCFTQQSSKSNATLVEEDFELLDAMKYLEEESGVADDDSALAPFTQTSTKESSSLNRTLIGTKEGSKLNVEEDPSFESDDELDFTMIIAEEIEGME